jgi:hypothetical protein
MMKISRNRVTGIFGCTIWLGIFGRIFWEFLVEVFVGFLSTRRLGVFGVFGSWEFLGFLVNTWLLNKIYFL